MGSIKAEAATIQLEALGFIKYSEDGKKFYITDKGEKRAEEILYKLPVDEQILLVMLGGELAKRFAVHEEPDEERAE